MCLECVRGETPLPERTERRKLWEIDDCYHCTIVGTCLSLRDLEKIAARAGIRLKDDATEYAIHVTFVNFVTARRDVAKLMHKALDKKYRSAINATKRFETVDEVMDYWRASLKTGRVPGAYWAAISHRLMDERSGQLIFGDVHMLSHMVGAANRADLKRLTELEELGRSQSAALEEAKIRSRQTLAERNEIIAELQEKLADYAKTRGRLVALEAQLAQYKDESAMEALTARCERLEDDCSRLQAALDRSQACAVQHEARQRDLLEENVKLRRQLQETQREADHLEHLLESGLTTADREADAGDEAVVVDLDGATVIYVGGRTSQMSHFRTFVERANGTFVHHDGGLEDGDSRLHQVLARGDIVMCPIDCVSHGACTMAKTYCKRAGKCFVPLRSSGLSSFVTGLQTLIAAD